MKYPPSNKQFVRLGRDLLKDPKYRSLSLAAKAVYSYLKNSFGNNKQDIAELSLSYSEMADMMSTRTLSRAFKELITKEFIKKTKRGGLYGGKTTYKLTGKYDVFIYRRKEII